MQRLARAANGLVFLSPGNLTRTRPSTGAVINKAFGVSTREAAQSAFQFARRRDQFRRAGHPRGLAINEATVSASVGKGHKCDQTPKAGRIVSVAMLVAVGVNTDSQREVLEWKVGASEA